MNHLKTGNAYFAQGSYKSNKYNGKELQETGMYSYGWREYMPDIGRWNGIDQLAENYFSTSPYAYVMNNPINMMDPDGRQTIAAYTAAMIKETPEGSNSYWFNNGSGFTSFDGGPRGSGAGLAFNSSVDYNGNFTIGDWENVIPVFINAQGSASTWNVGSNYLSNSLAMMNGLIKASENWTHQVKASDMASRMSGVRADGPVKMIGGTGDPLGVFDIVGEVMSNWKPENRYAAMAVGLAAVLITRSPSVARAEGWLAYHEAPTLGHTLARHVAKSDAELISRLAIERRITGASSFASEAIAESVISSTIKGNRGAIKSWLNSGSTRTLSLDFTGSTNVGRGIMRRTGVINDLTDARIVLKQKSNGGYFILTSFPK